MATYYAKLLSEYTVTYANLTFSITWANPSYDPFHFAGEALVLQAITPDLFVIGHDQSLVTLDWHKCTSPVPVNRDALIAAIIALRVPGTVTGPIVTDSITTAGTDLTIETGSNYTKVRRLLIQAQATDNPVTVLQMEGKQMSRTESLETVTTTDGTPASLFTFTPANGDVTLVKAFVTGKNTGVHGVAYELSAVYYRVGGTTTLGSAVVTKLAHNTAAVATDADLTISSPDIVVRVTGQAATTYIWDVLFTAYTSGPTVVTPF